MLKVHEGTGLSLNGSGHIVLNVNGMPAVVLRLTPYEKRAVSRMLLIAADICEQSEAAKEPADVLETRLMEALADPGFVGHA
jgi:hypothetical protein